MRRHVLREVFRSTLIERPSNGFKQDALRHNRANTLLDVIDKPADCEAGARWLMDNRRSCLAAQSGGMIHQPNADGILPPGDADYAGGCYAGLVNRGGRWV